MLLPDKHIRFSESLLGLGAFVLEEIETTKNLDTLWIALRKAMATDQMPATHSIDNLVLAIDMLYGIGALQLSDDGTLVRVS